MTLRKKRIYLTLVTCLLLAAVFIVAMFYSFRGYSNETIRDQARKVAEIVRVSLNERMIKGEMDDRQNLIFRLKSVSGLEDLRVLRGKAVIDQFGPGNAGESPKFDMEYAALDSGQVQERFDKVDGKSIVRFAIPYVADKYSDLDCRQCHQVSPGTVLGAISIAYSMEAAESAAIWSAVPVMIMLCLVGLILGYSLKRILQPVEKTAEQMGRVVAHAKDGNFSERVDVGDMDEIGAIATSTNELMETLEHSVGTISAEVQSMGLRSISDSRSNLLEYTVSIVKEMVGAARFKQTIEDDLNVDEIYERLRVVMQNHFQLSRFSLYEVGGSGSNLTPVFVHGLESENDIWCDVDILANCENCRACRTAAMVSSVDHPGICNRFRGAERESADLVHVCLPQMLSGRVGSVLQMVMKSDEAKQAENVESLAQMYLQEAAPVVESRKLMQSLKDTSMRDPMTGLYNRRFLEDYIETLTASIRRREATLGVMMCDVDYFKKVNDTYGHDVGDQVIKGLAGVLKSCVRESDLVIRFGGEEFMILLPDTDKEGCFDVAERIRKTMEQTKFQTTQGGLQKTVSLGLSYFPDQADAFWEAVKYADIALYAAKDQGRNRTLIFESSMWTDDQY